MPCVVNAAVQRSGDQQAKGFSREKKGCNRIFFATCTALKAVSHYEPRCPVLITLRNTELHSRLPWWGTLRQRGGNNASLPGSPVPVSWKGSDVLSATCQSSMRPRSSPQCLGTLLHSRMCLHTSRYTRYILRS